jgi:outer membrane protein OmpA-like peptidoglycan-associated protein
VIDFNELQEDVATKPQSDIKDFVLDFHFDSDRFVKINTNINRLNADVSFTQGLINQATKDLIESNGGEAQRLELAKKSEEALVDLANMLKQYPDMAIEIQGHTDSDASAPYNIELGRKRAETVRGLLLQDPLIKNTITTTTFGETSPIAFSGKGLIVTENPDLVSVQNSEQKAINRRIEIKITKQPAPKKNETPEQRTVIDWKVNLPAFLALIKQKQFCRDNSDAIVQAADRSVALIKARNNKDVKVSENNVLKQNKDIITNQV